MRRNDVNEFSPKFIQHADYNYLTTVYQAEIIDSISLLKDQYTLISDHKILFDGKETGFYIFYNNNPKPLQLTKYVRDKPGDFFTKSWGVLQKKL